LPNPEYELLGAKGISVDERGERAGLPDGVLFKSGVGKVGKRFWDGV
jgi:hypothetical protein